MPDVIQHPAAPPPSPEHASLRAMLREELRNELASGFRPAAAEEPDSPPSHNPLLQQFLVAFGGGVAVWVVTRALERRQAR